MSEIVYRSFDRQSLDREYSPSDTVPSVDRYVAEWQAASERARNTLQVRRNVPFGDHPDELLDIFPAKEPDAPVHVFLHGGYWRALSKDEASFHAEAMVEAGAAFVAVNYSLAPKASLDTIVDQCRRALAWVFRNAQAMNADPNRIFVAGHSAGGHLAGMLAVTDWPRAFGLPADAIRGVVAVSGIYDLEPIRLSHVNEWLKLDEHGARRNSPMLHGPAHGCPLVVAWAEADTKEFIRQSIEFGGAWNASGFECRRLPVHDENHFSVISLLGRRETPLGRSALAQMGLISG